MVERKIKYLLKFCSKEQYADDLIAGKLFMNAAGYYRYLEEGQGDMLEGALSHRFAISKGTNRPIYCMYAVFDDQIKDNSICIPQKVITDFHCENGWAVLLNFAAFEDLLPKLDTAGYALKGDLVTYGSPSDEGTAYLLTDANDKQLFIKHPRFAHQQEFRLVASSSLAMRTICEERDGVAVNAIDEERGYETITYSFPCGLNDMAQKISISDLETCTDGSRRLVVS